MRKENKQMNWRTIPKRVGKGNWIKMALAAVIALVLINVFAPQATKVPEKPFNVKDCLKAGPKNIKGLTIIEGSRSREIITTDMAPLVCRAKGLFEKMKAEGAPIESGSMVVRVTVEFNGEVISVKIQESDISYRPFRNGVINMIAAKDFMASMREDTDTVFLCPIHFGPNR